MNYDTQTIQQKRRTGQNSGENQGRAKESGESPLVLTEKEAQRFWSKVNKSGECWKWTAGKTIDGYGRVRCNGRLWLAHRVSWSIANNAIPDGVCVLHRCDNPPCCNPDHLFLGTRLDNNADKTRKGRQAFGERSGSRLHPECLARGDKSGARLHPERLARGEDNGKSKLTMTQVVKIRSLCNGGLSHRKTAAIIGIGRSAVGAIMRQKTWAHIL